MRRGENVNQQRQQKKKIRYTIWISSQLQDASQLFKLKKILFPVLRSQCFWNMLNPTLFAKHSSFKIISSFSTISEFWSWQLLLWISSMRSCRGASGELACNCVKCRAWVCTTCGRMRVCSVLLITLVTVTFLAFLLYDFHF